MATVNDILKKNKQINGTAAATPAVASADYTKYLANGSGTVGAMSTGAAETPTSASGSSSEEPGPLKKFWNDVVDGVNTGLDYLGNVGSAIGEGTTNVWNAVIGKPESAAPAAETETVSAPISYTANMGNTGMMTSSEYLADKEQSNDWYYDDKKDYLGKTKEDALREAEQAKTDAKIEAEALFRQNASNYGLRGEQMLEQGLAGGGYSEFLEGKNMETRAANYARADANALAEAQTIQQNYNAAMDELNTWKKNADDELRTEKLELSEQVRAERGAKWDELLGYVQQGVYSADEAATIWGAYANIYGNLTEAELQALRTAWANRERSKLDEYYDAFMEEYDTKGTKENYISYLVGKGFSEGVATDMANAKFAAAEEQQNQLIGSSLAALGDAVRGGMSASDAAELFKLQNPGKELTAEQMQSLQALENSYKTEAEGVIVEGLVEKALMLVQTLNEDATKEKVLQYIKNVDGYDPKYDERINAFVNTLFNPDGSLNVNNRTDRAAKLEQLYASGVSAEEAEMILTAWGYEGLNGAEMERFENAYSVKSIQAVQSYIASLAASGTFTQKGLRMYLEGLVTAGQLTDTAAANILNSYFDENGNRKTVSTTGELKQERNAIITTMVDAIRAGNYTAANGAVIVASQLGLEEGESLSVLEINALNAAYEEYKNQTKKDAVDKYMATVTALGGAVDKGLLFVYAVESLNMEPSLALEMVSQTYDANGKFIYNPTVGFAEGKENISLKNYTNEELLELLNKVGIDVGEGEITVPDSGDHVGEIGLSWDDYLKAIETVCNENGITLTDQMKNAAKSWKAEDGKYYITEGLLGQLKAIADGKENGGQPQPETKPETKPEEEPEEDSGFGDTINEGLKNFADSAKNFFGGAWDYSSKTVVDAYNKFNEWVKLPGNEGKTVEDYGKEMTAGSGAELISKIQSKDFNPSDKNYVSALLSSLENLRNNNLIGATAYETVVGMFKGDTAVSTAAEFDDNTWRKTMEPGDNFTVKIDQTIYKVQSAGKADATVQNVAKGVSGGKVFAYKGELYIKDEGGNVYKIEGRDLNQDGYNELWNAIFGSRITQACNVIIDEDGQEVFIGPMSTSTARQNAVGGNDDSAYVESNAEVLKKLQRGYAQARQKSGDTYYVTINGRDVKFKKGASVKSNETLAQEIAGGASLMDDGEVFVYRDTLYMRDGDSVYKVEDVQNFKYDEYFKQADGSYKLESNADKQLGAKKLTKMISDNATDRLNYSDALLDTGSVVKFDGASVSRIDKIEGGIGDVNVTLAYGDEKYKLEVHAVLDASSEAVKAADKAGVEDGQIFAHHEDLYIYNVDDNGKKQAYRLGATDFFYNKDYDKFKEAVTGKKIGDDNIFGNYTKNLTDEGGSDKGGTGEGGKDKGSTSQVTPPLPEITAPADGKYTKDHLDSYISSLKEAGYNNEVTLSADEWSKVNIPAGLKALVTADADGNYTWYEYWSPSKVAQKISERSVENGYYPMKLTAEQIEKMDGYGQDFLKYLTANDDGTYTWYTDKKNIGNVGDTKDLNIGAGAPVQNEDGSYKVTVVEGGNDMAQSDLNLNLTKIDDSSHKYYGVKTASGTPMNGFVKDAKTGETFLVQSTDGKFKALYKVEEGGDSQAIFESDYGTLYTKTAAQRGNANFESDAFGFNKSLEAEDNIRVEINGKTYHVQSGGEIEGDELSKVEGAAKDAGVRNREVFLYDDKIYMCYVGKDDKEHYYRIEERAISFKNDDDELKAAIASNAAWDASNDDGKDKVYHVTSGDGLNVKANNVFKVKNYDKIDRGETIKVTLANGTTYKLKARVQLFTSSEAYQAAKSEYIAAGQVFQHGRDLYMMQNSGVMKLSAVAGKAHNGDYEAVKNIVGGANVEKETTTVRLPIANDTGSKIVFYTNKGQQKSVKYREIQNVDDINDFGFKVAFDNADDESIFTYGDDVYYKDGKSAKELQNVDAETIKGYRSEIPNIGNVTLEKSNETATENTNGGKTFVFGVGQYVAALKENDKKESVNTNIATIVDIFEPSEAGIKDTDLERFNERDFMIVRNGDVTDVYLVGTKNDKKMLAKLKFVSEDYKNAIINAEPAENKNSNGGGSVVILVNKSSYGYNLGVGESTSKSSGGREFNYSDFT